MKTKLWRPAIVTYGNTVTADWDWSRREKNRGRGIRGSEIDTPRLDIRRGINSAHGAVILTAVTLPILKGAKPLEVFNERHSRNFYRKSFLQD